MPPDDINRLAYLRGQSFESILTAISPFADDRNVSRAMVIYQLLRTRIIDDALYAASWRGCVANTMHPASGNHAAMMKGAPTTMSLNAIDSAKPCSR